MTFIAAGHETTGNYPRLDDICSHNIRKFVSNCKMRFALYWLVEYQLSMNWRSYLDWVLDGFDEALSSGMAANAFRC